MRGPLYLLATVIFTVLWPAQEAAICYVCDSWDDYSCADPYTLNPDHAHDCSEDPNTIEELFDWDPDDYESPWQDDGWCGKEKLTGNLMGIELHLVARYCGNFHTNELCEPAGHTSNVYGINKERSWFCSCSGDYCNSSNQSLPLTFLLTILVSAFLLSTHTGLLAIWL